MQCAALILFNEAFSVSLWRLRDADMTSFPSLSLPSAYLAYMPSSVLNQRLCLCRIHIGKEPENIEFLFLNTWIFLDGAGCGWNFEYIITSVVIELSKVLPTLI